MIATSRLVEELDPEWLALILEAKELGISKDTIQNFFNQSRTMELVTEHGEVHKK